MSFGFSLTTLIDSPKRLNCIRPVRMVKYSPAATSISGTMYG